MNGNGFGQTAARADPLQRGLISHCYRLLGSTTEALAVASRAASYERATDVGGPVGATHVAGASELYEVATRACLARAGTRPLPTDLAAASDHPEGKLQQRSEVLWLEPIPDDLTDDHPIDLDFVAALQRLPAPERAALVLHDLEHWPEPRITNLVGPIDLAETRSHLTEGPAPNLSTGPRISAPDLITGPDLTAGPTTVAPDLGVLARYRDAFEQYDVPAIVTLFADDAIWEMPPFTSWFRGARAIGRLISTHCPAKGPGDQILIPVKANGQPAFAVYMRDPVDNIHRAFQLQVLTLTAAGIIHAIAFFDLSLFPTFHLPDLLTGLPPNPYDGTPRPHIERLHHD